VRLSSKGAEVVVPEGLTLEEAVHINEEAQKYDGIERIEHDGTVVLTDKSHKIMSELLHYDRQQVRILECESAAHELRQLYHEYASKHPKKG